MTARRKQTGVLAENPSEDCVEVLFTIRVPRKYCHDKADLVKHIEKVGYIAAQAACLDGDGIGTVAHVASSYQALYTLMAKDPDGMPELWEGLPKPVSVTVPVDAFDRMTER
jgi:hypothetical protein